MFNNKLNNYDIIVISRYNMGKGGLENVVRDQVISFLNLGLKVAIAFRKLNKYEKTNMKIDTITIDDHLSNLSVISDIIYAPFLYFSVSKRNAKIILDNFDFTILYAMFRFSKKRPIIVKVHHGTPNYLDSYEGLKGFFSRIYKLFLKLILILSSKTVDMHIAVSHKVKQELIKDYHVPSERIVVIPNGIDIEKFRPRNKLFARKKLNLPLNKKIVLFVGHDLERKGFYLALKIVELLKYFIPDIMFIVVTSPKNTKKIGKWKWIKVVNELPLDQLSLLYNSSDVLLFPSKYESFCLVAIEAIASGCPAVISTNIGALDDVNDGEGYLIANNFSEYLRYCKEILTSEEYKKKLIEKGRLFITTRYSNVVTHHHYENVISLLLN